MPQKIKFYIKILCNTKPNLFLAIQYNLFKMENDKMDLRDLDVIRVLYKLGQDNEKKIKTN